jgi:hypothetical protein
MPNASTTQSSSACETTGTPIPLSYGYVWATGKRHAYYMLQDTLNNNMDYTRLGIWLLGHGEWDGPIELWINDLLAWTGNIPPDSGDTPWLDGTSFSGQNWLHGLENNRQPLVFNFHSGCDAVIGSGLTPSSSGADQGCDVLWGQFPSAIQPLCFSRIAYYAIMRKQPVASPTNASQADPTQFTDIAPIGLWRALRCRLFDGDGNVTGYAFTRNPIWHWVDVTLRRELFPDYKLPYNVGPDPLPAAVSARFNWDALYASAQYCNALLANGQPRFSGDYSFTGQTSLQAIKSQIMLVCRGYESESQGKIALNCDMPRASVFVFSRNHMLPGSFEASDQSLNTGGNRILGQFRDILVPACSVIASIEFTIGSNPVVTTEDPHPFQPNDQIAIGGTGTPYDGTWQVSTVPDVLNPGTPEETDPTTFTMVNKGANYPTSVGSGGAVGLLYSRFKERTPEFWHKTNMLARGSFGLNIARMRNKVKQLLDFATSTYDQVSRISRYERDRILGFDQMPYQTPARLKFRTSMFAKDVLGNLACGIEPGDHVSVDNTFRYPYAGDYEVVGIPTVTPPGCELSGSGNSLGRAPSTDSGEIEFALQTYDEDYMYDTSDALEAGWPSVPGSYPGNDTYFVEIPLANGGNFVFFTGQLPSGSPFQLPSTGYPANNFLAWASPAGANVAYHSAHVVQLCEVGSDRLLTLIYADDEGTTWGGDINYAAVTWLSTDVTNTDSNGMTWLPLTLSGGEEILFGQGVLADGATIELPSGWTTAQSFAVAFIHDMPPSGNIMFLVGAYVDAEMVVHLNCSDDSGHIWHGNAAVMVFAWKNNMGTVTSQTLGVDPVTWLSIPLPTGNTFNIGCGKSLANMAPLEMPENYSYASAMEAILGSSDGSYEAGSNHAQGVGTCYLDSENVVHITFNDGSGDIWPGTADLFASFVASAAPLPVFVLVSPGSASVGTAAVTSFTASVENNSDQAVTWYVDGILGGNDMVGTIDTSGNYTAPNTAGTHLIQATSVADTSASGQAWVTVYGTITGSIRVLMTP